ncbi:hypothetical protein FVR03_01310 [Pontibacter qinzhouensis]|uniref:Uncharacterized protein n=1 Tax=Pontibacter qinzhouensis TaxID=2603253 RepID=A0A5C8KEZ3_9BACT|nr:hypothetical protein [Pontibacter qinzhouensis]TXK52382.1 hypothetical protein FVR03_01310 [Pontibacter qinzhouensis]
MADRAKVLAAIEARLKGKSLSKNFKENIATKWAEKIDTDENIDAYIEDREDILIEASSEADRRATEAATKAKGDTTKKDPDTPPTVPAPEPPKTDDTPAWAKALMQEVQTLKAEKQAQTVQQKVLSDERLKTVPKSYLKGRPLPTSEDEVDSWIEATTTDYKEFAQEMKLQNFGNDTPPSGSGSPTGKVASKAEIEAVGL